MNKLKFAGLITSLAVLAGCSSTQMDSEHIGIMDTDEIVVPDDAPPVVIPPVVTNIPENIPEWYINLPRDSEETIYGSGAGLSEDLQFSLDKALHQAKVILGDKISSSVSSELKTYMADNSAIGSGATVEETQRVSKSGYKNVDVSEYEIVSKSVHRERNKFRSFILLSLDVTNKEDRKQFVDHTTTPISIEAVKEAQAEARESLNNL